MKEIGAKKYQKKKVNAENGNKRNPCFNEQRTKRKILT